MKKIFLGVNALLTISLIACQKQFVDENSISRDETRLAATAVTARSISKGLIAYYPFSGNTKDASGNRYNGIGSNVNLTFDKAGKRNSAYSFNGINSYIYVNGIDQSHFEGKDFSISLNVLFRNFTSDFPYIIWGENGFLNLSNQGGSNTSYYTGKMVFYTQEQNSPYPTSNGLVQSFSPLTPGQWHCIQIVKSGQTISMFIDGAFSNSAPYYSTNLNMVKGNSLIFGYANSAGFTFGLDGILDEIRLYNRALTQPELIYLASN